MDNTLFKKISLFADEMLDPDDSYKKVALDYIKDCGVDINDTEALMTLSVDVGEKLEQIMKERYYAKEGTDTTALDGMYEEYAKINNGLMALIFNRFEEDFVVQDNNLLN